MEEYNFLYTVDKNYFPHMLTSLYSLAIQHVNTKITVYIIADGFTKEEYIQIDIFEQLYEDVTVKIYQIEDLSSLTDYYRIPKWRNTNIANARLFAHNLICEVNKILYIDSDTIIVNPLTDVFQENGNATISAVRELCTPIHLASMLNSYYNSGVLLFNYQKWNQENCSSILNDTMTTTRIPLKYPDQDLLNLSFSGEIKPLNISYNICPYIYNIMKYPTLAKKRFNQAKNFYSYQEIEEALETPHIYHYLGLMDSKPWDDNKINPFNNLYEQYRLLWDPNFKKERNPSPLTKLKWLPFINILLSTYIPVETYEQMNEKIKQKIHK